MVSGVVSAALADLLSLLSYNHVSTVQADEVAYLLDYCGPAGFPQQLAQHVSHVFALDHHKTAAEQLSDTSSHPPSLHVHLDMQRSGAMIAKDWFQPEGLNSELSQMYE